MQLNPNEPSRVLTTSKNLKSILAESLVEFLKKNLDVFSWTYADMVGTHADIMCHKLNINH